jgi:hypothetical protein
MNNEGTTHSLTGKLTMFFQVLWKTESRKLRGGFVQGKYEVLRP